MKRCENAALTVRRVFRRTGLESATAIYSNVLDDPIPPFWLGDWKRIGFRLRHHCGGGDSRRAVAHTKVAKKRKSGRMNTESIGNMIINLARTIGINFTLAAFLTLSAGCGSLHVDSGHPRRSPYPSQSGRDEGGSTGSAYAINIPKGHLPPPGACRIWWAGVEPGQQPPPGDCHELAQRVPPGAWLVSRATDNPELASVTVYDPQRPRIVVDVRWIEVATGRLVNRNR